MLIKNIAKREKTSSKGLFFLSLFQENKSTKEQIKFFNRSFNKSFFVYALVLVFAFLLNISSATSVQAGLPKCNNPQQCKAVLEKTAQNLLGARYSYGDTGKRGFDCSGFVLTLCKSIMGDNVALPRSSQDMFSSIKQSVSLDKAQKGDLLFFKTGNGISHVAMYWGKDSQGNDLMCHASSSKGVEVRAFKKDSYWSPRFAGIKRVNPLFQVLYGNSFMKLAEMDKADKQKINKSANDNDSAKLALGENEGKLAIPPIYDFNVDKAIQEVDQISEEYSPEHRIEMKSHQIEI